MARYIGQRIMTPTPGHLQQVVNNQVEIFKSTDRRGSVAIAISGTDQDEVATNFIYDSISTVTSKRSTASSYGSASIKYLCIIVQVCDLIVLSIWVKMNLQLNIIKHYQP